MNSAELTNVFTELTLAREILARLELYLITMQPAIVLSSSDQKEVVELIKKVVAIHFGISDNDFSSPRKNSEIAWPRQIAMALAREVSSLSLKQIGTLFGGRDHGTVIHAIKVVKDRCCVEPRTKTIVVKIKTQVAERIKKP